MANFLQRWFLPKRQYMILDFIDKNSHKVQYRTTTSKDYSWQTYYIYTLKFSLKATLQKGINKNNSMYELTEYTFQCLEHPVCNKKYCHLNNGTGDTDYTFASSRKTPRAKFVRRVYKKLMENYCKERQRQSAPCK